MESKCQTREEIYSNLLDAQAIMKDWMEKWFRTLSSNSFERLYDENFIAEKLFKEFISLYQKIRREYIKLINHFSSYPDYGAYNYWKPIIWRERAIFKTLTKERLKLINEREKFIAAK